MTSAPAVGRHHDEALVRDLSRARLRESAGIGSISVAVTAFIAFVVVFALDVADARAQSRCARDRDAHGVGRKAALAAMDTPARTPSFLYRAARGDEGYTVRVVVRHGPYVGDTWERDAIGRVKHVFDVCRDQALLSGT